MCDREGCWMADDECTADYHDAKLIEPACGAERIQAPIYTFTITRKGGEMEEVNSCFVEFTPYHVIFRGSDGRIDYGLHAAELIDIVQADHS